jgi:N-acetylated-alpha-linked acidic dipeptidase
MPRRFKWRTRVKKISVLSCAIVLAGVCQAEPPFSSLHYWPPSARARQIEYESTLNRVPSRVSLRAYHDQFASEPHVAGTPGDARTIQRLAAGFRMLGLDVQVHEFWAYLTTPIEARIEIVSPDPVDLPVKEAELAEDRFSQHQALTIGFNAYSADGDVTGEIVYANYGAKEDFAKLKELGIECQGKIVMARYGGNFRGYKAKFAQEAGAAGLIIYTDPEDSGYRKGVPYPEGGWANDTAIQRGSLNTLNYPGDPLTPGMGAMENAQRLNPDDIALPRIPVQPIGYAAAGEIMQRMNGRPLPQELVKFWQGGLPCAYRLEGGPELRVRVMVKQERRITRTANVVGTLWGSTHPDQKIVIGCHHDAWCHGAGDPLAGTILLFECAKSFFDATQKDFSPARSVVFAAWGAEEYGIIGSTEYCEQFGDTLLKDAVVYINLDAAAMGPNFSASASPSLKRLIEEATRDVPQARDADRMIHAIWLGDRKEPTFGNLGGGSDHVGFYCHLGIPSCGLNAGGSQGTAYHSNYDSVHWYRKVVGDDYEPAIMLARVLNLVAARLADAPLLPLDPLRYARDCKVHVQSIADRASELRFEVDVASLAQRIEDYERTALAVVNTLHHAINGAAVDPESLAAINAVLLHMERDWLSPTPPATVDWQDGSRPWFRNLFAASDPDSGYSAWMLPVLRAAVEVRSPEAVASAVETYRSVFDRLQTRMSTIRAILEGQGSAEDHP